VVPNPGGDDKVQVIDLVSSDNNEVVSITIKTIPNPSVATLYYDGKPVTAGQVIPNFDNKLLTVDPQNGEQTVEFEYTATDATGWESEPSTVKMPYSEVPVNPNFVVSDDNQTASTVGPVTTIDVLGNDETEDGTHIYILDGNNSEILWQEGTAVGGATSSRVTTLKVPGEGTWNVEGGKLIFTAEEGFTGIPTPIYYVAEDKHGHQSNVAQVNITSNCCDTYQQSVSDSIPTLSGLGMLLMMLLTSMASLLFRRELEAK
jgi:hypothetical protein